MIIVDTNRDTLTFTITVSEDLDPDEPPEPVPALPLAGFSILVLLLWQLAARRLRRLRVRGMCGAGH